jgi:3,4-dihydroxy 2-butanone 4-phosphate synthase/GTP cyclohydrolase II
VEVMNDDGTMARLPDLVKLAEKFNLKIVTIKDLIAYRLQTESLIKRGEEVSLPTRFGDFRIIPFLQKSNNKEHVALVKGEWNPGEAIPVRVHSSCMTGDIFGSLRCECGDQLHAAMDYIEKEGRGVIVYMMQEGRGIGLINKIAAYKLQDQGLDTVEANIHLGFRADERDYGVGAQILRSLEVSKMVLLTNNPVKRVGLEAFGLEVVKVVPLEVKPNKFNARYLKTKRDRMGHNLQRFTYDDDKPQAE